MKKNLLFFYFCLALTFAHPLWAKAPQPPIDKQIYLLSRATQKFDKKIEKGLFKRIISKKKRQELHQISRTLQKELNDMAITQNQSLKQKKLAKFYQKLRLQKKIKHRARREREEVEIEDEHDYLSPTGERPYTASKAKKFWAYGVLAYGHLAFATVATVTTIAVANAIGLLIALLLI